MDWDIKKLVNDPDWQGLPYEERFKAMQEVDPDFAALPAAERAKGIAEMRGAPDLKATHAANVAAGEAAYKPSWMETYEQGAKTGGGPGGFLAVAQQMGKDVGSAIEETPARLGSMIAGAPQMAMSILENPTKAGVKLIESSTEPLISPRTTGKALTEAAIDTALTAGVAKGGTKALSYAGKTAGPAAARRIVQSILKPAEGDFKFGKDPVNAFLEEKFQGSLPKVRGDVVARKKALLKEVEDKLAQSTETTSRSQVLDILEGEKARIAGEVGTVNDKALSRGIDTIKKKIEANYPEEILQKDVHKLRQEIDDSIPNFTSEAVEQGLNNVRYNLRSGLNDILETNSPGIKAANRRVSELIDIDRSLGNQARRAANAPLPGLGRGTTLTDLALGIPRAVVGSPAMLTRAANVLNMFAPRTPSLATAIAQRVPTQGQLPFVPGEVGTLATSMEGGPVARFPNQLTQEFNRPLNVPPPGQQQLPFVPAPVGTAAEAPLFNPEQSTMGFPNRLTQQFNRAPELTKGQQRLPFVPTLPAPTIPTVGSLVNQRGVRGLAGALQRTRPAEPFKGDIHSAVTQAAPAGPASTVRSPSSSVQIDLGDPNVWESLPKIPGVMPQGMEVRPGLAEMIDEIVRRRQRPRSALESTPTLMEPRRGGGY